MISEALMKGLNEQLEKEAYASFLYLSMSGWCERKGMKGSAAFLRRQSEEENLHFLKIFDYLNEVDSNAHVPPIQLPPNDFGSIQELMTQVYEHEQSVTRSIFKLVDLCNKSDDFGTFNFLQWYVTEQREEESLMRDILDKIKLIGDGPTALYYIDKEMETVNEMVSLKESSQGKK